MVLSKLYKFINNKFKELHRNMEYVLFLITFIPTEKLTEPTTIQMLKAITNY